MKRLLLVLLMMISISSVAQAQDPYGLIVSVGTDSAFSGAREDTIRLTAQVGDTISVRFDANDWPLVQGYFITFEHRDINPPDRPELERPLDFVGYTPGSFLSGPDG